jgi:hypothetical protein
MKHLRKIRLEDNPGLKEENSEEYLKLLEVIEGNCTLMQPKARELRNLKKHVRYTDYMIIRLFN